MQNMSSTLSVDLKYNIERMNKLKMVELLPEQKKGVSTCKRKHRKTERI